MAVKTITIDMEAYALLAAQKRHTESFSRVIKRRLQAEHTASALLVDLPRVILADETLDQLDRLVSARHESLAHRAGVRPARRHLAFSGHSGASTMSPTVRGNERRSTERVM